VGNYIVVQYPQVEAAILTKGMGGFTNAPKQGARRWNLKKTSKPDFVFELGERKGEGERRRENLLPVVGTGVIQVSS